MTLRAELIARPGAALLDELRGFCAQCPGRTYLQEPDWPEHAPRGRRHAYALATVRDAAGALVLAGVLRQTRLPLGLSLGAFRRGPLTRRVEDLGPGLESLLPLLRARGVISLTLNPRWDDAEAAKAEALLAAQGARPVPEARQSLHHVTGLLDLSEGPEAALARMSRTARRTIRRLDGQGITLHPLEEPEDVALYARWCADFVAARGMEAGGLMAPGLQVSHARALGGVAALVRLEGAPVGAFVALRDGDRLLPVGNGWQDPDSALPRTYILFWHLVERGAALPGLRWVDLGGLGGAGEGDAAARRRDAFKQHFAPRVVTLPRIHEIVLRPLPHRAAMLAKAVG